MQWEYMTTTLLAGGFFTGLVDGCKMKLELNQFGAQGWELVSVFDTNKLQGGTLEVVAILKRPLKKA